MHRAGLLFGLFLILIAVGLIACTPSHAQASARDVCNIFVVPPASADPLAEAAHDAFVRSLRHRGYVVPATPADGEIAARLSFEPKGASQALSVTLSDLSGHSFRVLSGPIIHTAFWSPSLAGDAATQLASHLGSAPCRLGGAD